MYSAILSLRCAIYLADFCRKVVMEAYEFNEQNRITRYH